MVACQPPSERRAVSFSRGSSQPVFASRFASHAYRAAKATMKSFRRLGGREHRPRYRRCADEFRGPPWLFLNETALPRAGGGWAEHAARAREMGFDWLYVNPWQYPGFSGSLYAIKDFRRINPLFLPPGADPGSLEPLRAALAEIN